MNPLSSSGFDASGRVPGAPAFPYCAIIGDIVHSRAIGDRGLFQNRFLEAMAGLDAWLGEKVASGFVVTAGDEFQGLLFTAEPVYDVVLWMEEVMGVRFRLGAGIGTINTELRRTAIGMDGPAFHRARSALDQAKRTGATLVFNSDRRPGDGLVNTCLALLELNRRGWTPRQAEIIEVVARLGGQAAAARALGVSPSAVSQALHSAGWPVTRQAREDLRLYLRNLPARR